MDSLNYKCRKSQSHPFTSYQVARLCGWGFPKLDDYTELQVYAGYWSVSLLPSSPFFATAKHSHLPYSNQIHHLQIPSGSSLTSQQPPASSSSSSLFPDASDTTLSCSSHLGGFSPPSTFQNCHHKQPSTFPGQVFQGGFEDSEPQRREVLGEDYLDPPVTSAPASLLKKLFCHQSSTRPSDHGREILPLPAPARK